MSTNFVVASQALTGFSNASRYEKNRPTYPAVAVAKLLAHLGIDGDANRGATVVEIGSGTGKFTELLAQRDEQYEIVAVEPHEGMRKELVNKHLEANLKVLDGDAATMAVETEWADAAIASQSFHWFATEQALTEIARVLKPGGTLGMIWNIDDYNGARDWPTTTPWERTLKSIVAELEDGHPRFRDLKWKGAFEAFEARGEGPRFSLPLGEEMVSWTHWLTDDALWARYTTLSQIANLDQEQLKAVEERVREALKDSSTERNEKGEIAAHGVTYLAWTTKV